MGEEVRVTPQKLHKAKRGRDHLALWSAGYYTVALCNHPRGETTRSWSRVTCKNCLRRKP
jgi:hypothetical protein